MRGLSFVFMTLLTFAACAPVATYHQDGVTRAKLQDDLLNCRVDALEDAPVATQIRRGAPRFYPGYTRCRSDGTCYRTGGYFYPGEVYTVDTNAGLRRDLRNRCMAQQGYSPVELPRCRAQAPALSTGDTLPPLTDASCVVKDSTGQFHIIDAAG